MYILTSRRLSISVVLIGLIGAITLGLGFKTRSQKLQPSDTKLIDLECQQIENSADQPLRALENSDAPFRILDAKVKEISGPDFTRLTGKSTGLHAICSVPQVRLLNTSEKVITGFVLAVRDPITRITRGVVQSKILINQGETYTLERQSFIEPEWASTVEEGGKIRSRLVQPDVRSDKYWISFASRTDMFVTVARVTFQDGSIWRLKEGGDIQ